MMIGIGLDISLGSGNLVSTAAIEFAVLASVTETSADTNKSAMQGVETDGTFFFTDADTTTNPTTVSVWNASLVLQSSRNTSLDFASHSQANGLWVDTANNKLYVGANNFPTTPSLGWVLEYNYHPTTRALTFVAAHETSNGTIGDGFCEGGAGLGLHYYAVYHDQPVIRKFLLSDWSFVKEYPLGTIQNDQTTNLYQGGSWNDGVIYANTHGSMDATNSISPNGRTDAYWLDTAQDKFITVGQKINPPVDGNQGLAFNGTELLFAERVGNNPALSGNILHASYTTQQQKATGPNFIGGVTVAQFSGTEFRAASLTAPAGSNRIALILASYETSTPSAAINYLKADWPNGLLRPLHDAVNPANNVAHTRSSIWFAMEKDIPSGPDTLSITLATALATGWQGQISVLFFENVDQYADPQSLASTLLATGSVTTLGDNETLVNLLVNGA